MEFVSKGDNFKYFAKYNREYPNKADATVYNYACTDKSNVLHSK